MHKIRPTRILSGFSKAAMTAFTGNEEDFVKQRKKYCFEPCEYNKGGSCILCGCVLMAKAQEELEYCPDNRWEDIKILDLKGIAIRNLSTDKCRLDYDNGLIVIEYINPITSTTNTTINLEIINDRANFDVTPKNLTNLRVQTGCNCTTTVNPPKELKDGHSFKTNISYKPKGTRKGSFAKTIAYRSSEENFFIRLKGINK